MIGSIEEAQAAEKKSYNGIINQDAREFMIEIVRFVLYVFPLLQTYDTMEWGLFFLVVNLF